MITNIRKILLISAIMFALSAAVMAVDYGDGKYYCHSRYIEGDAFIQRANDAEISEFVKNMPIMAGDRVWTENGRVEIQFDDGSLLNMDAGTKIDFEAIGENIGRYEDSTIVKLWSGSVFVTLFHDRDSSQSLQVQTISGSISLLNGGSYRIDLGDDYSLRLTVINGLAEVSNYYGNSMVRSGQRLFLEPDDHTMDTVAFADTETDEFNEWVMERTSHFKYEKSAQYVDDTLDYLVDEMDDYGEWRYSEDYDSYVWIPRSNYVYNDWRPYNNGTWVWTPHGWTFVSYDPWGWVSYRYGRWDWSPWGWCWIPGYRYSPAWVYWEIGYDYIGWVPIGYYNYPVSRYAWKDYPRGYKPRNWGKDVNIDVDTWTVVHKAKFGKEAITKGVISKADISRINRKDAKIISIDPADKGFTDRKISYTISKSSVNSPVFKDLPEGAYNKLIKKNSSTGSSYSWSSSSRDKSSSSSSSSGSSTSSAVSKYKQSNSGSTSKYIYKSGKNDYYKKGSSSGTSTKSDTSKYKSSYSSSKESKSSSSSSSSKSSVTKSSKPSSSTSSPVKKKDSSSASLSSGSYRFDRTNSAYRSTERYTVSDSYNHYKVSSSYNRSRQNSYSTSGSSANSLYQGLAKRSYSGNYSSPNAYSNSEKKQYKSSYSYSGSPVKHSSSGSSSSNTYSAPKHSYSISSSSNTSKSNYSTSSHSSSSSGVSKKRN